ncbi:hypothetical protein BU17DRAFT_69581 [Hysterangium stoloniferum]|nr:hypothetical protein BU17DRAFT_69581 [Hysterangium stoloniferum]
MTRTKGKDDGQCMEMQHSVDVYTGKVIVGDVLNVINVIVQSKKYKESFSVDNICQPYAPQGNRIELAWQFHAKSNNPTDNLPKFLRTSGTTQLKRSEGGFVLAIEAMVDVPEKCGSIQAQVTNEIGYNQNFPSAVRHKADHASDEAETSKSAARSLACREKSHTIRSRSLPQWVFVHLGGERHPPHAEAGFGAITPGDPRSFSSTTNKAVRNGGEIAWLMAHRHQLLNGSNYEEQEGRPMADASPGKMNLFTNPETPQGVNAATSPTEETWGNRRLQSLKLYQGLRQTPEKSTV